jgi:hypothetical protein
MLCRYEDLVLQPEQHMRAIYGQLGQDYPATGITSIVHSNARKKGREIELSPQVEQICHDLEMRLESAVWASGLV